MIVGIHVQQDGVGVDGAAPVLHQIGHLSDPLDEIVDESPVAVQWDVHQLRTVTHQAGVPGGHSEVAATFGQRQESLELHNHPDDQQHAKDGDTAEFPLDRD